MLWMGLAVLGFAVVMAATGRVSPIAFGGGLGLLVMWFLFERERPASSVPTEEELSSLAESLHESSTEFDLADFPVFLRRMVPLVTRGFGEREVSRLVLLAERLPHNRESQVEFQIAFQGASVPLRVRLFRGDVSSVGVYFFTSRALADLIDSEMESFFEERGM